MVIYILGGANSSNSRKSVVHSDSPLKFQSILKPSLEILGSLFLSEIGEKGGGEL